MQFRVLGPVEVDAGDGPLPLGGPKQRAVLANLLVRANEVVPAETLIEEIWGDDPPGQARNTLQTYVSNLRKALGDGIVLGRPPGYVLVVDPIDVDATRFDALVRDATKTLSVDPKVAIDTLEDALAMWRGPALADVAERSLLAEAARLDERRLEAQEQRIGALLATGSAARAIGELEPLLAHHPLRERLWEQLMLALYRDGRQSEALTAFHGAREILADELGIDPSPELVHLQRRILAQDPALELRGEPLRGYRLLEKLGETRHGVRFRAIQPRVGRDVDIELLNEHVASGAVFVERFEREAQAVAALEHPHVVPIYDYWREPGRAYVVRRYLRGPSLEAVLSRGEELGTAPSLRLLEQVASALALAHRQHVAHGDLDAENVTFDGDGNAYLGGFEIGTGHRASVDEDLRRLGSLARRVLGRGAPPAIVTLLERTDVGDTPPEAGAFAEAARRALAPIAAPHTTISPDATVPNPYRGLRAFREADAPDFFGRSEAVRRIIHRLADHRSGARFLAVVGPSGCGKSSLVRAGVVPALRGQPLGEGATLVSELTPGGRPFDELEAALGRLAIVPVPRLGDILQSSSRGLLDAVARAIPGDAEVVLVVDQLEELFTLTGGEATRTDFLECLRVACADPESRVRVIATLRADFYDRPLVYPRFGALLADRTEAVAPLLPDELEQAVRRPAERAGVRLEPGLVAELIADAAHQPGALPMTQFALTELFERRVEAGMTLTTYRELGGIVGALSTSADELVRRASSEEGRAIRQVFLRLVTLGEGRADTRRRVVRSSLDALDLERETVDRILDMFGQQRILTFDREPATREPTVEIAHEALLIGWPRLHRWIDDAREDLGQERSLARAADEWIAAGNEASFLLRGARLAQVEGWDRSTDLALPRDARRYLAASTKAREVEHREEELRRAREVDVEHRAGRRLRALVAVFAAAALIAGVLVLVATDQGQRARREAAVSSAGELAAASAASLSDDPERAVLLAIEAVERSRAATGAVIPDAEGALHRAVARSRIVTTLGSVGSVLDWGPDGRIAAQQQDGSGMVATFDQTGALLRTIDAHAGDLTDIAFSPDGRTLVTAGSDGWIRAWDVDRGTRRWEQHADGIARRISFDAVGSLVAAAWDPLVDDAWKRGKVLVANAATGTPTWLNNLAEVRGLTNYAHDGALSPDGSSIAVVADITAEGVEMGKVISLADRTTTVRFRAPPWAGIGALLWSPDGRYLSDGAHAWDATTGELEFTASHDDSVISADWSPDGRWLVTGSLDGTARVWEVGTTGSREPLILTAAGGIPAMNDVSYAPDGRYVLTSSDAARIWDASPVGNADISSLALPTTFEAHVAFTQSGKDLVVTSDGGSFTWGLDEPSAKRFGPSDPKGHGTADIDPVDGAIVRVHGHFLSLTTQEGERRLPFDRPTAAAWMPDGVHLVVTSADLSLTLIDLEGGEVWRSEFTHPIADVAVGSDGRIVVAQGSEQDPSGDVVVVDGSDGSTISTIHVSAGALAFNAADSRVVVGGWGSFDALTLWDADTGRQVGVLPPVTSKAGPFAISPDGSTLAVMSTDGVAQLYGTQTRTLRLTLPSRTQVDPGFGSCFAFSLAFSADGSQLATQGCDGVRIWALHIDDLLAIAHDEVLRPLTVDECRVYLHVEPCPST